MSPPSSVKKIKCMKTKLSTLNKKIRHSKRKHNNLVSKPNSITNKIEKLKRPREQKEKEFSLVELEQAFGGAYRSYIINGRSRMDLNTFFDWIRQILIDLMSRELTGLGSARVQPIVWIRFEIEYLHWNR